MINNEIKEKYGIEPIMKEMWVWDDHKTESELLLVLYKRPPSDITDYPFFAINNLGGTGCYSNISETNPNDKEPKVGDKGYFWDDERYYAYDSLHSITDTHGLKSLRGFNSLFCGSFVNFSHEKQPWMK